MDGTLIAHCGTEKIGREQLGMFSRTFTPEKRMARAIVSRMLRPLLFLSLSTVGFAASYTVTPISILLPSGFTSYHIAAINNVGGVAGEFYSAGTNEIFIGTLAAVVKISQPPAWPYAFVSGLNDFGAGGGPFRKRRNKRFSSVLRHGSWNHSDSLASRMGLFVCWRS